MATWAEVGRINGVSFGQVLVITTGDVIPTNTQNRLFVDLAGVTPQPVVGDYYNPATDQFSSTPFSSIPKGSIPPYELWFERITNNERGIIFTLAQEDGGGVTLTLVQRGRLKAFLAYSMANDTPLEDPEAVFIFNALETAGAIASGRADEILE